VPFLESAITLVIYPSKKKRNACYFIIRKCFSYTQISVHLQL